MYKFCSLDLQNDMWDVQIYQAVETERCDREMCVYEHLFYPQRFVTGWGRATFQVISPLFFGINC